MKMFNMTARQFTTAISMATAILGASASVAEAGEWEYYWATPNSRHVQPMWYTRSDCEDSRSGECQPFVTACGIDFFSTVRVADNALRFINQGYTLEVYTRGGAEPVCYLHSR